VAEAAARSREKLAGGGAVVAAGLASMCCILPLALGALGLSGVFISAFFEPLRPYLLGLAGVLLAAGFYLSFRAPRAGEVCAPASKTASAASRPVLFVAAAATAALALFPSIVGLASGGSEALPSPSPSASSSIASSVIVLHVEGMTCEACTSGVRARLLDVPGVIDAAVSYRRKLAEVRVREERAPETASLVEAVEKAGFSAEVATR
jgi:copper chaperone CopZ